MENYQEQYKQELHQQEINSNLRTLKGGGSVKALGKVCVSYTDLCDLGDHCGIFVIPCGAYLCAAVAFGGTVQGADDTVDHLCCE